MFHDAGKFLTREMAAGDPEHIRRLFRGYLREKISAALFLSLLGAASVCTPFFATVSAVENLFFWGAGGVCFLLAAGLVAFRQTDPVTSFLRDPHAFVCCPAVLTSAMHVPASARTPASVRVFTAYTPMDASDMVIETRFLFTTWPFFYSSNGHLQTIHERSKRQALPLPVAGWVIYKRDRPEFSFLSGISAEE